MSIIARIVGLPRYAHGSNRIARTCIPCLTPMFPFPSTRGSVHPPRSARIGCPACMNGNYSISPKEESATERTDRDPLATQDDPAKFLTQDRQWPCYESPCRRGWRSNGTELGFAFVQRIRDASATQRLWKIIPW